MTSLPTSGGTEPLSGPISLTQQSAVALAAAVRSGSVTSRQVIDAHIGVLEQISHLNALARDRFDLARDEADAVDRHVAADAAAEFPPLFGVPVTIKELIAVAGMPHSGGMPHRRHHLATEDATTVRRLREAGAIVLGVGNSAGPYYWVETFNLLYGRTDNAYDPSRTAGGSSGGDAVAVSTGGTPIALGSDLGGSVRVPAFFNGVFGHLPSPGLVPITGHFPIPQGQIRHKLSLGPLARRAEDLLPMLRVMSGPDGHDTLGIPPTLGDPTDVSLDGLRVVISRDTSDKPATAQLEDARNNAADALARAGARVSEASLRPLRHTVAQFIAMVVADTELRASLEAITRRPDRSGSFDPMSWALLAPAMVVGLADSAPARFVRTRAASILIDSARRAADQIADLVGDGVLLHPPFPRIAPPHHSTHARPWLLANTLAFNVLGLPTTQVPLGIGEEGMPIGVQVAAAPGNDHVTIRVAAALESAFGGWVQPGLR